jgi:hypothetical protein
VNLEPIWADPQSEIAAMSQTREIKGTKFGLKERHPLKTVSLKKKQEERE